MLTTRVLPPEEWERLLQAGVEPYASGGLPDPTYWRIIVVERDGAIVATSALFDTVHWDCFWVAEGDRGNPTVFKDLIESGIGVMADHGITQVHTTVPTAAKPEVRAMLERFGFTKAPGDLYFYERQV